ncbi:hypothetical protein [Marmoricola sp. RAF53]|uniref:hypothetical protein n=1 Tax=Marmoricola sp. RAF53 TaxID=3233059 RepID=UPI003F978138
MTVDHHQVSFDGASLIHGELDLVEALDLDARLSADAAQLKEWGSEASLDARRAEALGNLARGEMVSSGGFETGAARLPQPPVGAERLPRPPVGAERLPQPPVARRPITLYLHLDPRDPFGRHPGSRGRPAVARVTRVTPMPWGTGLMRASPTAAQRWKDGRRWHVPRVRSGNG